MKLYWKNKKITSYLLSVPTTLIKKKNFIFDYAIGIAKK